MDNLTLAKGVTSTGGLLGTGTGVYYGANSEFNELFKNWDNVKGWLLYEKNEIIGTGDGSVAQWTKAANRYKSYFSFRMGEKGSRYLEVTELSDSVDAKKLQGWCEEKFKSTKGKDQFYGKVRKWCTKHVTMEDKLKSEGMKLSLTSLTSSNYDTLLDKLKDNTEDRAFLDLPSPSTPPKTNTNDEKTKKAKSWCESKANIDLKDGEEHYGIFKEVCGKK